MILWRLTRHRFQALDGEGARINGGRWNSEGIPVVYFSSSLSLAALEYLVHIDIEDVPQDLIALKIVIPENATIKVVDFNTLEANWSSVPDHPACVRLGDEWAKAGESLLLEVPSAVVPIESNYLLNSGHPTAIEVKVIDSSPFSFDRRLLDG